MFPFIPFGKKQLGIKNRGGAAASRTARRRARPSESSSTRLQPQLPAVSVKACTEKKQQTKPRCRCRVWTLSPTRLSGKLSACLALSSLLCELPREAKILNAVTVQRERDRARKRLRAFFKVRPRPAEGKNQPFRMFVGAENRAAVVRTRRMQHGVCRCVRASFIRHAPCPVLPSAGQFLGRGRLE